MPGFWSWSNLACKPCDSFDKFGDDGAYHRMVAHAQQCANHIDKITNSQQQQRQQQRRLLLLQEQQQQGDNNNINHEGIEMIVVSNVLTNSSDAEALFVAWGSTSCENTTSGGTWKYAYVCKLSKYVIADPFQVLRALKATVKSNNNITDFLSPATRVVPYADSNQSLQGLSPELIVGLIVGGGILLVFIIMCCVWFFLNYHQKSLRLSINVNTTTTPTTHLQSMEHYYNHNHNRSPHYYSSTSSSGKTRISYHML